MSKKVTLEIKVKACAYCNHADKAKLRQHRKNYCDSQFVAFNGHCKNLDKREDV